MGHGTRHRSRNVDWNSRELYSNYTRKRRNGDSFLIDIYLEESRIGDLYTVSFYSDSRPVVYSDIEGKYNRNWTRIDKKKKKKEKEKKKEKTPGRLSIFMEYRVE